MTTLVLSQLLNGVQYGVLLFLLAAGLTLVFGIMSFVNLTHGHEAWFTDPEGLAKAIVMAGRD